MANSIALFKTYVTLLDEVYKEASLTAELDGAPELVKQGANANELIIPKLLSIEKVYVSALEILCVKIGVNGHQIPHTNLIRIFFDFESGLLVEHGRIGEPHENGLRIGHTVRSSI